MVPSHGIWRRRSSQELAPLALRLAHAIASAWDVVIVKGEANVEKARAKLVLYECAKDVLGAAMRLLSIRPLERM